MHASRQGRAHRSIQVMYIGQAADVRLRRKLWRDSERCEPCNDIVEYRAMLAQVLLAAQQGGRESRILARRGTATYRTGQRLRFESSLADSHESLRARTYETR